MGFEPTTASLEGWNSTTELRPPSPHHLPALQHPTCEARIRYTHRLPCVYVATHTLADVIPSPRSIRAALDRASSVWWAGKDSNLGRHKPADLQSAPFGHLGTCPQHLTSIPKHHRPPNDPEKFHVGQCQSNKSKPLRAQLPSPIEKIEALMCRTGQLRNAGFY